MAPSPLDNVIDKEPQTRQSPINIEEKTVKFQEFRPFTFTGYENLSISKGTLKVTNTGTTLKLLAEPGVGLLTGGPLNVKYEFVEMHFHWGDYNASQAANELKGSEHTFNGKSFPLELHMVHKNIHDETLNDSLQHENGLCVLGFMFDIVESDMPLHGLDKLARVINYLAKAETVFDQGSLEHLDKKRDQNDLDVNIANFFPRQRDEYFTYRGSLTTGGFQEAVNWVVFRTPLAIKKNHLEVFKTLQNRHKEQIKNNFRNTMPIYNRPIYYSGEELLGKEVVNPGKRFGLKTVELAPVVGKVEKISLNLGYEEDPKETHKVARAR